MTVSEALILYTRADCHLCDLAAAMMDKAGIPWRPVDIDGDLELAGKYGMYVPVLAHPGSGRELYFPFDETAVAQFLAGET